MNLRTIKIMFNSMLGRGGGGQHIGQDTGNQTHPLRQLK